MLAAIVRLSLAVALMIGCALDASAQTEFVFYIGKAFTLDSRVRLQHAGDSDLAVHGVSWTDRSFDAPIYYGLRLTHWQGDSDRYGTAIEFIHAKMYAHPEQVVRISGFDQGGPVDREALLASVFQRLTFSHGYNLLTVNAMYRPSHNAGYLGVGAGIAYPHVEISRSGQHDEYYRLAGWTLQGLTGLSQEDGQAFAPLLEYKVTASALALHLRDGSLLRLEPLTHHLALGASYRAQ